MKWHPSENVDGVLGDNRQPFREVDFLAALRASTFFVLNKDIAISIVVHGGNHFAARKAVEVTEARREVSVLNLQFAICVAAINPTFIIVGTVASAEGEGLTAEMCGKFLHQFRNDLPTFFTQTIPNVVSKIGEFFKALPGKIYNAFVSAKQSIVDIGSAIIDGIFEGLKSIGQAIKDFVDGFVQGFKDALGIHSPSTVFKAIGEDIVAGLLQGVEGFTNMMNTVKEWGASVIEWFTKGEDGKNIVDHFKEIGGNIIGGFKDKISTTYTNVKTSVTTWASKVKEWFTNSSFGGINRESFATFANNTIEGFKTKVSTAYTNVKTSITTWASKVKEWFTSSSFGGVNFSNFSTFANNTIEGFNTYTYIFTWEQLHRPAGIYTRFNRWGY